MNDSFKRQAIGLFCGIFAMSSLIVGLLSIYKYNVVSNDNENVAINNITLKSDELNSICISNSLPMSDVDGKNFSLDNFDGVYDYYDFEVTSNYDENIYFEVYLTKEDLGSEIDPHYVKLYLVDLDTCMEIINKDSIVPTYYDLYVSTSDPMGKRLYYGLLSAGETKRYRLKMWLSDAYSISDEFSEFEVRIHTKVN